MLKADALKNILVYFENAKRNEENRLENLKKEIEQRQITVSGLKEAIYLVKVDLHKVTGEGDCTSCFWSFAGGCSRINPNAEACLVDGIHTAYDPKKW